VATVEITTIKLKPRAVWAALATALAVLVWYAIQFHPLDLSIYLWGGRAVGHDAGLYLVLAHGNWFTYPPFAATVFAPLAALPPVVAQVAWELASVAALAWSARITLELARWWPSGRAAQARLLAAVVTGSLLLEPVYHTLYLGQVNLLLLALVLTDVRRAAPGRAAGIGVGLAAAIKLTPGIFIALFLLARRTRAAAIAAATFAGCGLAGYLLAPHASRLYWTKLFYDVKRVYAPYVSNQSLYGAVTRIAGGDAHVPGWYLVLPIAAGAIGLATAAALARRGDWLGGAAAAGVTGLLVSPISWSHHWVWVIPALAVLIRAGHRAAAAGAAVMFAVALPWWTYDAGLGFHGLVTLVGDSYLVAGLAFVGWLAARELAARRAPADELRPRVAELAAAGQRHGPPQVRLEQRHDLVHAALPAGAEAVQEGPAGHAGPRAERDGLEDVAAAADAAVADDLDPVPHRLGDRRHELQDRGRAVQLPAAVVGQRDRLDARVRG
jgi:alpha-1,2-mannosyltransferase